MIPALLSIATVIAAVWLQVTEHSRIIGEKKMNAHVKRVWAVCRTAVFILVGLGSYALTHGSLLSAGLNIAGSLFLFPALFNPWINKAQGWHQWYLGGTSDFDVWVISKVAQLSKSNVRVWHQPWYSDRDFGWPPYRDKVHRAGKLYFLSCLITSALLYGTGVILSNTN